MIDLRLQIKGPESGRGRGGKDGEGEGRIEGRTQAVTGEGEGCVSLIFDLCTIELIWLKLGTLGLTRRKKLKRFDL